MADVTALPLMLRTFLRAYPWRGIDPVPCARLEKPIAAIRPPRALAVPYPLGYPLGAPDDPALQRVVLRALLDLCTETTVPMLRTIGS